MQAQHQQPAISKNTELWLGRCLRHDLEHTAWATGTTKAHARGGLFYLLDISPSTAQAKYSEKPGRPLGIAGAKAVVEKLVGLPLVGWVESKGTHLHGSDLKIYMGLFDLPVPATN